MTKNFGTKCRVTHRVVATGTSLGCDELATMELADPSKIIVESIDIFLWGKFTVNRDFQYHTVFNPGLIDVSSWKFDETEKTGGVGYFKIRWLRNSGGLKCHSDSPWKPLGRMTLHQKLEWKAECTWWVRWRILNFWQVGISYMNIAPIRIRNKPHRFTAWMIFPSSCEVDEDIIGKVWKNHDNCWWQWNCKKYQRHKQFAKDISESKSGAGS